MKTKRISFSLFFLFLMLAYSAVQAQDSEAIVGTWFNTEKDAIVTISRQGDEFVGKITWLKEPMRNGEPTRDEKNESKELQQRPILGLEVLTGLRYKNGSWKGGTIYDPKTGNTYSCELKLLSENALKVTGYVGFSWIGRTVEWTKSE